MIVFCPSHNRPGVNPDTERPWVDATGAFQPEARAFAKLHGIDHVVQFDSRKPPEERGIDVAAALRTYPDAEVVAIFCHGGKTSLQVGLSAYSLAAELARFRSLHTVILYACDTGRDADKDRADDLLPGPGGDGGYADTLRDELAVTFGRAVTVYAHAKDGHCSWNPYWRRFSPATQSGGEWVIPPPTKADRAAQGPAWRAWRKLLREAPGFRFRFPLESEVATRAAVANATGKP